MKNVDRMSKTALWVALGMFGTAAFAFAQSQSQPAQPAPSSQSQAQSQPQQKDDSAADAAKKPAKDKPKPKRVYTEEDLSGLRGNGVSVVGDANGTARANAPASQSSASGGGDATKSVKDEEYWRGRASQIKEQMVATDEAIKNLQEEIKKNGATGFDAQSGLKQNVIYVDDRNARLKQLEQRRQDLDKQMDLLQEEGRKAGADSAWFR
jgi:hypothetical protein